MINEDCIFSEIVMKKRLFLLIVILLILSGGFTDLAEFGEKNFCRWMEQKWARAVFDLDEEEAKAVFGDEGEAIFL